MNFKDACILSSQNVRWSEYDLHLGIGAALICVRTLASLLSNIV
ncbi:MAG: hypothetical protein ABF629_10790 [Sporolactobacillus sp.]